MESADLSAAIKRRPILSLLLAAGTGMIFGVCGGFSNPARRTSTATGLFGTLAKFAVETLLCLSAKIV
ncbi:MAG: hypothetical protein LBS45_05615 [Synergistaceae bacterium]|nr:hypothetical protein [Synergistaceae bacterium]